MPSPSPAFRGTGNIGTSGVFSVPEPSPSLDPAAMGPAPDPKDKTRSAGFAALAHSQVIAKSICATARSCHADQSLALVDRHRRAAELTAKAITPFLDTHEKAVAIYAKEISKLCETLDGPIGDFNELQLTEIRSKLSALPQTARYNTCIKAIAKGNDAVLNAVLRSNDFLTDFLTDGERAEILKKWRIARFPEETATLDILESDLAKINGAAAILTSYQRACANQSIVEASNLPPMPNVRGPGPQPVNRAGMNSMSIVERARATGQMIAAQQAHGR